MQTYFSRFLITVVVISCLIDFYNILHTKKSYLLPHVEAGGLWNMVNKAVRDIGGDNGFGSAYYNCWKSCENRGTNRDCNRLCSTARL